MNTYPYKRRIFRLLSLFRYFLFWLNSPELTWVNSTELTWIEVTRIHLNFVTYLLFYLFIYLLRFVSGAATWSVPPASAVRPRRLQQPPVVARGHQRTGQPSPPQRFQLPPDRTGGGADEAGVAGAPRPVVQPHQPVARTLRTASRTPIAQSLAQPDRRRSKQTTRCSRLCSGISNISNNSGSGSSSTGVQRLSYQFEHWGKFLE